MKKKKMAKLKAAGWAVGDAGDFLELSDEERELVEMKLGLVRLLRKIRTSRHWTQTHVARQIKSSQSRVAKMEAGDVAVSIDLLVRSLLQLGASRKQLANAIARPSVAAQRDAAV